MKAIIYAITDVRDRILLMLAYLTAGRISEVLELKAGDLVLTKEKERPLLLIDMGNRKNKRSKRKFIPIPMDSSEGDMAQSVIEYARSKEPDDLLFPSTRRMGHITRAYAWQLVYKHADMNPHFLRHIRLTHLATVYGFPDQLLVQFAGWSDSRPAKHYMSLRWQDILPRM